MKNNKANFLLLFLIFCFGMFLRTYRLNNTFLSSDNAFLATKILTNPGYRWMIFENYGVLINFYVKVFTGFLSLLGIPLNEFWFKLPIAIIGSAQIILSFGFLNWLMKNRASALLGAGLISILPIHVMQSRYLWGYEVLGTFFLTIAIWVLLLYFENPTKKNGFFVSLSIGFYSISHGYILPGSITLFIIMMISVGRDDGIINRLRKVIHHIINSKIYLIPLLFLPLTIFPLIHALSKDTRLGFYVFDYLCDFLSGLGAGFAILVGWGILKFFISNHTKVHTEWLFLIVSFIYSAPLIFGASPGTTVAEGYFLISTYFLLLFVILILNRYIKQTRLVFRVLFFSSVLLTTWGIFESVLLRDQGFDPSFIKANRGMAAIDPGSKAAAYEIRTELGNDIKILALHGALEPPNMEYYFGKTEISFFDLTSELKTLAYQKYINLVDVVVVGKDFLTTMSIDPNFYQWIEISSENVPQMWVFLRNTFEKHSISIYTEEFNSKYDLLYPKYSNLLD